MRDRKIEYDAIDIVVFVVGVFICAFLAAALCNHSLFKYDFEIVFISNSGSLFALPYIRRKLFGRRSALKNETTPIGILLAILVTFCAIGIPIALGYFLITMSESIKDLNRVMGSIFGMVVIAVFTFIAIKRDLKRYQIKEPQIDSDLSGPDIDYFQIFSLMPKIWFAIYLPLKTISYIFDRLDFWLSKF